MSTRSNAMISPNNHNNNHYNYNYNNHNHDNLQAYTIEALKYDKNQHIPPQSHHYQHHSQNQQQSPNEQQQQQPHRTSEINFNYFYQHPSAGDGGVGGGDGGVGTIAGGGGSKRGSHLGIVVVDEDYSELDGSNNEEVTMDYRLRYF